MENCQDYYLHNHLIISWNQTHDDDLYLNTSEQTIELIHIFDIAVRARNNRQLKDDPPHGTAPIKGMNVSHDICITITLVETYSPSRTSYILYHTNKLIFRNHRLLMLNKFHLIEWKY